MIRSRSLFGPALLAAFGLAFAILAPASAQAPHLNVKLGLWEATTVVQTSGSLPFDMSKMTPEQRARFEAMMEKTKKTMGMPHTFKTCITQEKLEQNPFENKDQSCKNQVVSSSSSAYDVKFQCSNEGGGTTTGEWRFDAASPELVKGTGQMTIAGSGRKMDSTTSMTAKWIGASCGNVR